MDEDHYFNPGIKLWISQLIWIEFSSLWIKIKSIWNLLSSIFPCWLYLTKWVLRTTSVFWALPRLSVASVRLRIANIGQFLSIADQDLYQFVDFCLILLNAIFSSFWNVIARCLNVYVSMEENVASHRPFTALCRPGYFKYHSPAPTRLCLWSQRKNGNLRIKGVYGGNSMFLRCNQLERTGWSSDFLGRIVIMGES